jgi:hypothetical protein
MSRRLSKTTLALLGGAAAFCIYLGAVTFPIRHGHTEGIRALRKLDQTVADAARELAILRDREAAIAAEAPIFAWATHLTSSVPRPYLVETPLKVSRALRDCGLESSRVQLVQLLPFPALPDYAIAKWEVELPAARVVSFGHALAALENSIPLGQLTALSVQKQGATADARVALEFETLVQP